MLALRNWCWRARQLLFLHQTDQLFARSRTIIIVDDSCPIRVERSSRSLFPPRNWDSDDCDGWRGKGPSACTSIRLDIYIEVMWNDVKIARLEWPVQPSGSSSYGYWLDHTNFWSVTKPSYMLPKLSHDPQLCLVRFSWHLQKAHSRIRGLFICGFAVNVNLANIIDPWGREEGLSLCLSLSLLPLSPSLSLSPP